ncbi:transposase [Rhodococcoides kroppenstedtii]|uniref:transposase n=1 Tax=Rhodococcoides kroppenstedtii TaxID=293050 RepID=UPI0035301585
MSPPVWRNSPSLGGRCNGGGRTLQRRRADILAYFTHRASKGPTEAVNGRLEALRRNALGFRNPIHYRIRSLLHCGNLTRALHALEIGRAAKPLPTRLASIARGTGEVDATPTRNWLMPLLAPTIQGRERRATK